MDQNTKTCARCGVTKPRSEYHTRGGTRPNHLQSNCKACQRELKQLWKDRYPDRNLISQKKSQLKLAYGITLEAFEEMVAACGGKCQACQRRFDYDLHVDHCHDSGRIRGLLCRNCNVALGHLSDSLWGVQALLRYARTACT